MARQRSSTTKRPLLDKQIDPSRAWILGIVLDDEGRVLTSPALAAETYWSATASKPVDQDRPRE